MSNMASLDELVAQVQQRYPNATREQVSQALVAFQASRASSTPKSPDLSDIAQEVLKNAAEKRAKDVAANTVGRAVGVDGAGSALGALTGLLNIGQAIKEGRGEKAVLGTLGLAVPGAGPLLAAASILPAISSAIRGPRNRIARKADTLQALDSQEIGNQISGFEDLTREQKLGILEFAKSRGALQFPGVDELKDGKRVERPEFHKDEFIGVADDSGENVRFIQPESSTALKLRALQDPESFKEERQRLQGSMDGLNALQRLAEVEAVNEFVSNEQGSQSELQRILEGIKSDFSAKRRELGD